MSLPPLKVLPSLILHPALPKDVGLLARWWADGTLLAWVGFPNGLTTDLDSLRDRLRVQNLEKALWILEAAGRPIGEANHRIVGSEAEVGVKIWSLRNRGRGWGRAGLGRLLEFLWTVPQVARITLDTWKHNHPARRCYESLGFRCLGPIPPLVRPGRPPRTALAYSLERPIPSR